MAESPRGLPQEIRGAAGTVPLARHADHLGDRRRDHPGARPAHDAPAGGGQRRATQRRRGRRGLASKHGRLTCMATFAVFIALAGSATAAVLITGKNVKDGTLTGKDIKNSSVGS